ncbi:MAG: hypothetical protein D8M58_10215 [Calditrichaeota bacterium]|nr:MAG: hypothetical protein DWQ03_09590 [Calditrichota bacterium]MBL1205763.1 hypothetical protein [Calditrichota bacterium]NOG45591.1 hypothetical protein [Calditrichota bacterium]
MKYLNKIFLLGLLFILPIKAQIGLSFSAGPGFYERDLNLSSSAGFNFGVSYILKHNRSIGLEIHQNNLQQQISTPLGSDLIPTSVKSLKLNYKDLLTGDLLSLMVYPQISFGIINFQRNAYSVQLGAFGKKEIQALNKRYFVSSLAMNISKNIYKQASLFIRPQVSVYDFENYNKIFSIAGGIDVRLF